MSLAEYEASPICDYSDLREVECAHHLGHKLPPEYEAVAE